MIQTRLLVALMALSAGAQALAAQARPQTLTVPAGAVSGTVVAAASGQPVPNAVVVLESASDAAVVSTGSGPFVNRSLLAVTDESGSYKFGALPAGEYRLVVRHLGFRPAIVSVDLAQAAPFRVSVGLVVNPIQLDALDANAPTAEPYGRLRTASDESRYGDLAAEQYKDTRYLEGDASVITHSDVIESVTLGETDLFRAVQRLPGVSARDDYTAALWTRGAPWSQTRVYFDGQPLFNPVHAVGVFAAVNTDAVGAASFHPGVRSSSIGEGTAGVLNIGSRRPATPGFAMLGELSMISAHGAADWASRGNRVSGMFAARRSYVDVATRLAESMGADSGTYIPYAFYDLTGRFDADLGKGFGIEASGLWEEDDVHGDVNNYLLGTKGHWGNRLGRATLTSPLGGLRMRTTVGVSDFIGDMGRLSQPLSGSVDTTANHAPMHNALNVVNVGTEIAPADGATRPSWSAGIQASFYDQNYVGQFPRPYPVVVITDSLVMHEQLPVFALWGEKRIGLGRHMAIEGGLRVEAHRPVMNAPSVGLAPKLSFRATPPGTRITFTAAAARSYQYTQALAPAGPSVGPDLYVTDVWFLAGDTIPVIRADIVTTGIEAWLGLGWTASLNLYARRSHGMAVPEPSPGALAIQGQPNLRPIFVPAENLAQGVELSARRLVGRWTMSAAYSYGTSDLKANSGFTNNHTTYIYPSSADRRHVGDLTAMLRLGRAWRAGGAFTFASGAPFSRFLLGQASACDSLQVGSCDSVATAIGNPNNARTTSYSSLDLLLDWTHTSRSGVTIGAYFQLRNVFNNANAITYTGSVEKCTTPHPPTLVAVPGSSGVCDRFDKGVPILPLAGIRVAF